MEGVLQRTITGLAQVRRVSGRPRVTAYHNHNHELMEKMMAESKSKVQPKEIEGGQEG